MSLLRELADVWLNSPKHQFVYDSVFSRTWESSFAIQFSIQNSAEGILHLQNLNSGPNSGKQILAARILDRILGSFFFMLFFPAKEAPEKFTPRNSPPKIHLPKLWLVVGIFANVLKSTLRVPNHPSANPGAARAHPTPSSDPSSHSHGRLLQLPWGEALLESAKRLPGLGKASTNPESNGLLPPNGVSEDLV